MTSLRENLETCKEEHSKQMQAEKESHASELAELKSKQEEEIVKLKVGEHCLIALSLLICVFTF